MAQASLVIDGKMVQYSKGDHLLWVALNNGIYIPHLCANRGEERPQCACGLCYVEIEGQEEPVRACAVEVLEGMVVNTRGSRAMRLSQSAFGLLMASHRIDCVTCIKKTDCELHRIAGHLRVKPKPPFLRELLPTNTAFLDKVLFDYDLQKCVLCGRCVWVCEQKPDMTVLGFVYRGFRRAVHAYVNNEDTSARCRLCGECVAVCPTGALRFK